MTIKKAYYKFEHIPGIYILFKKCPPLIKELIFQLRKWEWVLKNWKNGGKNYIQVIKMESRIMFH